jgi:glycosyltransferase involved in cell wall biosynthesis
MRVLVIGHTYMTRFAQAKYGALVRADAKVSVLCVVPEQWHGELAEYVGQERAEDRFKVVALPTVLSGWGSRYFFVSPRLLGLLRTFRPEVVQVEHEPAALVLLQLNLLFGLLRQSPKIVLFSWEDLEIHRSWPMRLLARLIHAINVPRIGYAIPGNTDAVQVLRRKGFHGPMRLLPQIGVDPELFSPGREEALRGELDLGGSFVVGFVGRIVPEKGLRTLVSALISLKDCDWKLLLVGRGDLLPELAETLNRAAMSDRLKHVPSIPHLALPPYYRCMDAFVLPSETTPRWKEQFGHVLLEAMASGVPVIGSSSGYIPAAIRGAGVVFPEGDATALARELVHVIDDDAFRTSLIGKGHDAVADRYSHDAVARCLLEVYAEVSGG